MSNTFPIFTTVPPSQFKHRTAVIQQICARLEHSALQSTVLVGGPSTGRTSLLQYLTSKQARDAYPSLARSQNIFISGDALGLTATPEYFWAYCFKEIQLQTDSRLRKDIVSHMVNKTRAGKFDLFDLEDFFDICAKANQPVVLFIDDFVNLLKNVKFWPPNDFFHQVRSLAQRIPRGLSFVVATPRPLIELWDPSKNASPFYNVFLSVSVGRLTVDEVRSIVRDGFTSLGEESNEDIESFVAQASGRHPGLTNYIAELCVQMIQNDGQIDVNRLQAALNDPAGPVVALIRRIREELSLAERQWLDAAMERPQSLTAVQTSQLRRLWEYGLVPPGVPIP